MKTRRKRIRPLSLHERRIRQQRLTLAKKASTENSRSRSQRIAILAKKLRKNGSLRNVIGRKLNTKQAAFAAVMETRLRSSENSEMVYLTTIAQLKQRPHMVHSSKEAFEKNAKSSPIQREQQRRANASKTGYLVRFVKSRLANAQLPALDCKATAQNRGTHL